MSPHWVWTVNIPLDTGCVWDAYFEFLKKNCLSMSGWLPPHCALHSAPFFNVICDTYLVTDEKYSKNAGLQ